MTSDLIEVNIVYNQDCIEGLKTIPDNSVNCCVTSPPYYGLRDYGVDGQIGLEDTPKQYVEKMVAVFREVRRVLMDDGTLWLNLGDSYAGSGCGRNGNGEIGVLSSAKQRSNQGANIGNLHGISKIGEGLKPKDLIGIPWMVAFALRADGWYLRQDIIWHKPNPMPESVTDRCTKSHEYIFLMSKSQRYYYDYEVIQEKTVTTGVHTNKKYTGNSSIYAGNHPNANSGLASMEIGENKNKRSVWTVSVKPFKEAHFATFPPDLIVDCIKAGCPENGIVLDPFMGAGTTAVVARKLNRNYIGFELNHDYCKIQERRIYEELGMYK